MPSAFDSIQAAPRPTRSTVKAKRAAPKAQPKVAARRMSATPVKADSRRPAPAASKKTLGWLVAGSVMLVLVIWVAVVGLNLNQSASSEDSLYQRIKREVVSVFGGSSTPSNNDNSTLTNQQITELEQRVFPTPISP